MGLMSARQIQHIFITTTDQVNADITDIDSKIIEINVIAVINVPNCVMFLLTILSLSLSFRSAKPWIYVWFSQGFCDISR